MAYANGINGHASVGPWSQSASSTAPVSVSGEEVPKTHDETVCAYLVRRISPRLTSSSHPDCLPAASSRIPRVGPFRVPPCSCAYRHLFVSCRGAWSDVAVHVWGQVYRLHRLVLSQSPTLNEIMRTSPAPDLFLDISDPYITKGELACWASHLLDFRADGSTDSLAIALGYLYSSSAVGRINHTNARSVLATAFFLRLPALASIAVDLCVYDITAAVDPDSVTAWVAFVDARLRSRAGESVNGIEASDVDVPSDLAYGDYSLRLREHIMSVIFVSSIRPLPNQLTFIF
jgi:hypothetical protein